LVKKLWFHYYEIDLKISKVKKVKIVLDISTMIFEHANFCYTL